MKSHTLLILAVIALVAAVGGWVGLMAVYEPGHAPWRLFLFLSPVESVIAALAVLLAVAAAVMTLAREKGVLGVIAGLSAGLGAAGFLYGAEGIRNGLYEIWPITFAATAASWAETLLVLSLGLLGAVVALAGRAWNARRP